MSDQSTELPLLNVALPPGKACADCQHLLRTCSWLIQQRPDATECDWAPSRFLQRHESDTEPSP